MVKKAIRLLIFTLIGVLLLCVFTNTLSFHFDRRMDDFHKLKKNTADVLVCGSSHAYRNIDPSVMFEEYGISCFDLGTANQWISLTYYQMKEAFRTQKPKVIILDVYKAFYAEGYPDRIGITLRAISGMHSLKNKIDAIRTTVEDPDDHLYYLFDFSIWHSRYSEIKFEDIHLLKPKKKQWCLGYAPLMKSKPMEVINPSYITERTPLSSEALYYLDQICELAKENECELVFCLTPYITDYEEFQPYYNSLEDYAKEKGIPFINMDFILEKVGIDSQTDFNKSRHLAASGAYKTSKYLCEFLKENYELEDHRSDDSYALYEKAAKAMYERRALGAADDQDLDDDEEMK